jgi:hypothetical protein
MIELKLSTSSPYGAKVSECPAVLNDQWVKSQFDLRVGVEYGYRETLIVSRGGAEYELDIEGKSAPKLLTALLTC